MFNLPDLRGRVPIGQDDVAVNRVDDTEADSIGGNSGEDMHTLTINEMPSHTHTFSKSYSGSGNHYGWPNNPNTRYSNTQPTGSAGDNQPHNNMPPFLTLRYIIFVGK